MFRPVFYSLIALGLGTALAGCKLVKTSEVEAQGAENTEQTDAARMAVYAEEIWEARVLPVVNENLVPLPELRTQLAKGLDVAGAAHGLRPEGEANPWNFAASGSGTIIESKLKSRAAKLQVDTDADGKPDVTVQLGPIIRGTALRDAMPFLIFTDFRDQIEFAKLAGALNAKAHEQLTLPDPESDVIGQTVQFEGVFTLRKVDDVPEVVPTALTIGSD